MDKILDNPVWNATISFNNHLTTGNDKVKIFHEEVGPFAGLQTFDLASFSSLYDMISQNRAAAILSTEDLKIPEYFKIKDLVKVLQMTGENIQPSVKSYDEIVSLEKKEVPQMIALTQLTHPGPFLQRTIEFGNYTGIFKEDKLVAMAGQRLHPYQYIEISAVCVHPDHAGKGYAKSLINKQLDMIIANESIPFLHVRADNENAINVYKHLGFTVRRQVNIYVIHK